LTKSCQQSTSIYDSAEYKHLSARYDYTFINGTLHRLDGLSGGVVVNSDDIHDVCHLIIILIRAAAAAAAGGVCRNILLLDGTQAWRNTDAAWSSERRVHTK